MDKISKIAKIAKDAEAAYAKEKAADRKTIADLRRQLARKDADWQKKIEGSYLHWRQLYRMLLDPHIVSNAMAIVTPTVVDFVRKYPHLTKEEWFALFFLHETPFAANKEIKQALKNRLNYESKHDRTLEKLIRKELVEYKYSLNMNRFKYFYSISLKGRELIGVICRKSLNREILDYLRHRADDLFYLRKVKNLTREDLSQKWDWVNAASYQQDRKDYEVNSAPRKAERAAKKKIATEKFKQSEQYQKWKAQRIAAGRWIEYPKRSTPPDTV